MTDTNTYAEMVAKTLKELGVPSSFAAQRAWQLQPECSDLVSIGTDVVGREQQMERSAATVWQSMASAAAEEGVLLLAISAFRSFDYQRKIIERKLANGQPLEQILRVSALPGYSEHHTGQALDIGFPGCEPLTEEFEHTPAFAWLALHAARFNFSMSYPRDNPHGVIYEPWHWRHRQAA